MTRTRTADAVVVGGGLIGMLTALQLHERGVPNVAVIDKWSVGGVASPRAAGMLRRHYHLELLVELATRGEAFYRDFAERYGHDVGFARRGYLLAQGASFAAEAAGAIAMQRRHGVDIEVLEASAVERDFPEFCGLGSDHVYAYERSCTFVDPRATTRAVRAVLAERGVILVDDTPVRALQVKNGRVVGVATADGQWSTERVVNAAGAWSAEWVTSAGIDLPVAVHRRLQIIEVATLSDTDGVRILSHEGLDLYARPCGRRRMLIGGRLPYSVPHSADDVPLVADLALAKALRARYASVSTLAIGPVIDAWLGIDGDTPDYQPVVGAMPDVPGLFIAAGFSGHGFKLAPAIGELIADLVLDEPLTVPGAVRLGPTRFAAGELFERGTKQMGA